MENKITFANRTMGDIYELVVENSDTFIRDFPMQILLVEDLDKVELTDYHEHSEMDEPINLGQIACFVTGEEYKSGVCLINNTDNVKDVIQEIFKENVTIQGYGVESVSDIIGIDINTNITGARLIEIYKHALIISKELCIETPLIIVSYIEGKRAFRWTGMDENGNPVGDVIFVTLQGKPRMIHSIAHELRHCWQEYKAEGYYKDYVDVDEDKDKYINSKEEIDANAFASKYLNSLGYDGIRMVVDDDDAAREPRWRKHLENVKKRLEEL